MTTTGIDYSFSEPDFNAVKKAGYSFALSYFSNDQKKDWSRAEMQRALSAGLAVGAVFETTSQRPLAGYNAGVADARNALAQALESGYTGALYFAVDFKPSVSQLRAIYEYFRGVTSVIPKDQAGVYGSFEVLHKVQGLVKYGWQVSTWAPKVNGKYQIHPIACILQDANTKPKIANTDHNVGLKDDMGLMGGAMSADKLTEQEVRNEHKGIFGGDPGVNYDFRHIGGPLSQLQSDWLSSPFALHNRVDPSVAGKTTKLVPEGSQQPTPSDPVEVDYDKLADAIADKLAQRLKD